MAQRDFYRAYPTAPLAVSFVDLVGYTAITETHGDELAADMAQELADIAIDQLAPGDRLVKTMGDAVLISSASPVSGIELLQRISECCARASRPLDIHAGAHYGPVIERNGDIFGATVNLAARIAATARSGQVLVTHQMAHAARVAGMAAADLGARSFRNVTQHVSVFELELQAPAPYCVVPTAGDRWA
ncbi:adenylate/guanylate cyclase domain-containing protein [Nocardia sp. NPDC052566]|uniref:adenylate/guanylate cyclase domain-containing protein n=1 Tax=Nocardia sp. NPDC052566 TaxID=3364330 RepID=UPI0037C6E2DA